MILLLSDYGLYQDKHVHVETTNESFKRYASLLRSMGITNWMWPLMLHDKRLINVDPHDPVLDLDTRVMIIRECRRNPIYAIREAIRIPAGSGGKFNKFRASRSNMASIWAFFNNINQFYMQPRQTGKTMTLYTILTVCMNIVQRGTKSLLVTKDNKLRKESVRALKDLRNALPDYLNQYDPAVDSNNQEEISAKRFGNHLYTAVGTKDKSTANNIGRGFTVPAPAFDEPNFTDNFNIIMPAVIAAGNAARPAARAEGMPAAYILTSTAGERDRQEGKFCYDLQMGACFFQEKLYDAPNRKTLYHLVVNGSSSRNRMLNVEFNHRELGLTDRWIYEQIKETGTDDEEAINRDFFNLYSSGRLKSPLTKEQKEYASSSQRDAVELEFTKDNYIMRHYVPDLGAEIERDMHTIGVDTSDAVGRDDISYVFTNSRTGKTSAVVYFNEGSIPIAANWLADLMVKYRNTLLVIEAKSSARTFIDTVVAVLLANKEDPFKRIYNAIVQNSRDSRVRDYQMISGTRTTNLDFYMGYKKDFGFMTTGSLRGTLYSSVFKVLINHGGMLTDKKMVKQLLGLVERNGRIDHMASEHDDLVFSKLLSLYPLLEGRNIQHYGLNPAKVLTAMPKNEKVKILSKEDVLQERKETMASRRMEEINDRIESGTISENERRLLTRELSMLKMRNGINESKAESFESIYQKLTNPVNRSNSEKIVRAVLS